MAELILKDILSSTNLKEALLELLNKHNGELFINCQEVNKISTLELQILLSFYETYNKNKGKVVFKNVDAALAKIAAIVGFTMLFKTAT